MKATSRNFKEPQGTLRNVKTKAIIISFEGPEGSGKTTVIEAVERYLSDNKYSHAIFREPGSTGIGEQIRSVILHTDHTKMHVYTELLLYLACRAQLIKEKIEPILFSKKAIILDRYTDSTIVYQGVAGGLPVPWLTKMVDEFSFGMVPDITFLLDVTERVGLQRSQRKDRMEQKSYEFHKKVRRGYRQLARQYPQRIRLIPSGSKKQVIADVLQQLGEFLRSK